MNRRQAVVFKMMYGWDNLSSELQTVLLDAGAEKTKYCVDYGERDILWVEQNELDELCQNSLFWNALVNKEITSYKNFNIRTKSDIIDTANDGFSNDNTMAIFMCDDSSMISSMTEYLSDSEYQSDFVLTADFIDNRSYIKTWIRTRKIDSEFDLRRGDEVLKEGVKNYYNLTDELGEI